MAHFLRDIRHRQQQQQQRLQNAGEAFYRLLPNHVRHSLRSLFNEIDANRDGTISVQELLTHVSSRRFADSDPQFATIVSHDLPYLFPLLDADGNRSLDFDECKALFLLLVSRVVCSFCRHLILSNQFYFCTNCYLRLCDGCYAMTNGAYNRRCHRHAHHFVPYPGVVVSPELYAESYLELISREQANHHQQIVNHPQQIVRVEHPQPIMALPGNINPIFHLNYHNFANLLNTLGNAITIGTLLSAASAGGCVVM